MNIIFNQEVFVDGYLADKYSKYAADNEKLEGIPYINFPFTITELEEDFNHLSWTLIDHDSNPVVQFSWIHWLVANYSTQGNQVEIAENLKMSNAIYNHGVNSFACPLAKISNPQITINYGGPTPPDKEHIYTLTVYAHNQPLNLTDGFFYNQLLEQLDKVKAVSCKVTILARN